MADTMKVRFRLKVDGYRPGDEKTLPESEALRYIDGKCAVPVRGQTKETATNPPEETADALPEWTMNLDPATYLERFPEGPNAELAREHLEADDAG